MKNPMLLFAFLAVACALAFTACTKKSEAPSSSEMTPTQLIERGKAIYAGNCIACHNMDPSKDGSVGPAVAGSSLELVEARVMRAEYPNGFKAKRETHMMAALPHLKNEVPALAAYLSSLTSGAPSK